MGIQVAYVRYIAVSDFFSIKFFNFFVINVRNDIKYARHISKNQCILKLFSSNALTHLSYIYEIKIFS